MSKLRNVSGSQQEVQRRIGKNVRTYGKNREITMRRLAEELGYSEQSFHERLSGSAKLGIAEALNIAERLQVRLEDLLADEYAPRDSNPEPADTGSEADVTLVTASAVSQAA